MVILRGWVVFSVFNENTLRPIRFQTKPGDFSEKSGDVK